jgi:hypothetical protein
LIKFLSPLPQYLRIYGTRYATCVANIVQVFRTSTHECTVISQWILKLLSCEVNSLKDFKASRVKYLKVFNNAKPDGTFMLNPTTIVIEFKLEVVHI